MGIRTKKKESETMVDHASIRPQVEDLPFTFNGKTTVDRRTPKPKPTTAPKRAEDEPTIEMTTAEIQEMLRQQEIRSAEIAPRP